MKVFVSSLIAGFETYRAAIRRAVLTLRHEPIMAEDFGATPHSPQVACLNGLRESDLVVLVLGANYGAQQPSSGLSATHEEYREARGRKPVVAFVQQDIAPEAAQAAFISEVQGWEGGLFRGAFTDEHDLQAGVVRALHDYELSRAVAPVDEPAMLLRAEKLLEMGAGRHGGYGEPVLKLAVVGGPKQKVLRPVQIEAPSLKEHFHKAALFGEARIFDGTQGVANEIRDGALVLEQERGPSFVLDEEGSVLLCLPATERDVAGWRSGLPALIDETVQQRLASSLAFAAMALEHIDPTQRITHVGMAVRIEGAEYLGWRTVAEQERSPTSMRIGSNQERSTVLLAQPRAALRLNTASLIEDLIVPLRRQWRAG